MKKLRFGIVGTGNIAHRFANAIKNVEEAELVAVASRSKESAEAFADEFDIPFRYSSYEAMAKADTTDVAYIAVPHSFHKACSCLMMNNGKHVICEKPIAVNAREAEDMFDCAQKNGVFLMEAMWARLVPGTLRLLEIIREGRLGEIKGVSADFCYSMDEDEMNHHVMQNWNGGGGLLDVGVYCLNVAQWYLGNEVENLSAFSENSNGIDNHTCIMIKYTNGGIAQLSSAVMLRKPNEGCIYGTKGYVRIAPSYAPHSLEINYNDGKEEIIDTPWGGNGFEPQIRHVCSCISQGLTQSPIITKNHTMFIMRQMDEIRRQTGLIYPQDE